MADTFDTDAVVPPGVNVPERPGITLIHPYIAPQQASTTQPGSSSSGGGGGDRGGASGGGGATASKTGEKHTVQPKPTQAPPLNIPGSYRPGRVQPARRASPTGALGQVMHHGGGITAAASGASTTPHPKTQAHPTALLTAHSHTKVALEPTPSHALFPLGNLSQTMRRFSEFGTPRPVRHPDGHHPSGFLRGPLHDLSRAFNFYAHAKYGTSPQDERLRHHVEALQQAGEYANQAARARNPGLIKREEEERIARLREKIAKPREGDEYGGGGGARPAEEGGGMPSGIGGGTEKDESWTKPKHRRWWNA